MSFSCQASAQEKSDCAVVPVNLPNKRGPFAEAGEGRAQTEENTIPSHNVPHTERETHVPTGLTVHIAAWTCTTEAWPLYLRIAATNHSWVF